MSDDIESLKYKFVLDGPKFQTIEGHNFARVDKKDKVNLDDSTGRFFTVPIPKGHRGYGDRLILEYMGPADSDMAPLYARMNAAEGIQNPAKRAQTFAGIGQDLDEIINSGDKEAINLDYLRETFRSLKDWMDPSKELELLKNDVSRLHQFVEAMKARRVLNTRGESANKVGVTIIPFLMDPKEDDKRNTGVFVVQHAWSKLIEDPGDPIRMPFPITVFEFNVSNAIVILVAATSEDNDEAEPVMASFVRVRNDSWVALGAVVGGVAISSPIHDDLVREVRAICISLEVNVLTHSVVRAPNALNQKRERSGKAPLKEYHLLNLARRYRVSNPSNGHVPGHHKRLHLRRGHWRHFADHRTWIKWTLAGDPALGFIEKDYAL